MTARLRARVTGSSPTRAGQSLLSSRPYSLGDSDPIEKKPLTHFHPGSRVLSFGTAGCNLACRFCQNWDISKSRQMDTLADEASPEAIARAAEAHGCRSVAFTYNDPVIFAEYALDVADACHARGIETVEVTAGDMHTEPRREFYAKMDAANVDLKAFTEDFHWPLTAAHLQTVLETLEYVKRETRTWLARAAGVPAHRGREVPRPRHGASGPLRRGARGLRTPALARGRAVSRPTGRAAPPRAAEPAPPACG